MAGTAQLKLVTALVKLSAQLEVSIVVYKL